MASNVSFMHLGEAAEKDEIKNSTELSWKVCRTEIGYTENECQFN